MRAKAENNRNSFKGFGLAAAAIFSAVLITLVIPSLSDGGMYFLFLTAIIFSTLHGDVGSGIFAAALSFPVNFLLLDYHGKSPQSFGDWLVLFAFGLAAGFTIFICHAQMSAEAARRLAESKYRMIFEDAITGIYQTTLDGRYAAANPKLAEMFGYQSSAEMVGESENLNRRFYVEPERREEFMRLIEQNERLAGFESEIFRRGGEKIWITENSVAVRDRHGKLIGFQGTTIEITDRKRAVDALEKAREELEEKVVARTADLENANKILREEIIERVRVVNALRESEEKFRNLVEATTDWIWESDGRGVYTYASPQIKDLIGFEPEEIVGKRAYDLMPPDEAERVKRIVRELTAAGSGKGLAVLESVQIHKNGKRVTTETSSVPYYDENGELMGARGIARDITERKRIEHDLLASQKQLRDLSAHLQSVREEERKSLARELHDELGQTLTALKIELVRLDEKAANAKKSLSAFEVKDKIPAMLTIVDAAMDTTRKIVAELRPGVLDELGLAAAMEWQVGEFQKRTGIKCGLEIEFDENAACQNLKTTVFRILQECLTNIARHSGAGAAQITLRDEGFRIFFEIEDDGRGISRRETSKAQSFGILGMRERALLLGGTVEISCARPHGTRVSVSIPRPAQQQRGS